MDLHALSPLLWPIGLVVFVGIVAAVCSISGQTRILNEPAMRENGLGMVLYRADPPPAEVETVLSVVSEPPMAASEQTPPASAA